uniref:M1 family aminopeptidase n=1 Tax=Flavobacterium sp. TaxID=239 RepID=UPI00404B003D
LGDSLFWEGIRNFYREFQYQNASSEAFWTSMEKSSGQDLDAFFKQWLYQSGHPKIKASLETKNGQQYLNISQTQKQLFSFPLKVAFHDENNNVVMMRYQIAAHENSFALPPSMNDKRLTFALDPFMELLFEE